MAFLRRLDRVWGVLYRDEIEAYVKDGTLDKLDLAWSREGPEKVYVQHLMAKHATEIWDWIDNGGYFYVCGDKNYMAKDVHTTLINICAEHGGMSEDDAKQFVEQTRCVKRSATSATYTD